LTILCRQYCVDNFKQNIETAQTKCWIQKTNKCDNITIHTEKVSCEHLTELQTTSGVHLVASQTEGWGHYMHEAKSLGACCIYSDYSPMKEFFQNNVSGIAVHGTDLIKTFNLPKSYGIVFTPENIETAVNKTLKLSLDERKQIGENAKKSFYKDRIVFLDRANVLYTETLPNRYEKWII
jgi:hypothetical protein